MSPLSKLTSGEASKKLCIRKFGASPVEAGPAAVTDHDVAPGRTVAVGLPRAVVLGAAVDQVVVERADRQADELQGVEALIHPDQPRGHLGEQLPAAGQLGRGEVAVVAPLERLLNAPCGPHHAAVVDLEEEVRMVGVHDQRVLVGVQTVGVHPVGAVHGHVGAGHSGVSGAHNRATVGGPAGLVVDVGATGVDQVRVPVRAGDEQVVPALATALVVGGVARRRRGWRWSDP